MKKSDPSNIVPLQNKMRKCLSSDKAAVIAYVYSKINDNNEEEDDYPKQSPDYLVPFLAAYLFDSFRVCFESFLPIAYKDGQNFILKSLGEGRASPLIMDLTIQKSLMKSYDLIKSSLINLISRLYSKAKIDKEGFKKEVKKDLSDTMDLIIETESMRQKVAGAADVMRRKNIKKVVVLAEYRTAGDDRVCPRCQAYERKVFPVEEIEKLIPQHPRCRCWFQIVEEGNART